MRRNNAPTPAATSIAVDRGMETLSLLGDDDLELGDDVPCEGGASRGGGGGGDP